MNDCIDGDFLKHKANRISEIRNVKTNHACFMPEVGIFQYAPALHTKFFWATDAAVSQSFADFTGEIKKMTISLQASLSIEWKYTIRGYVITSSMEVEPTMSTLR